MCKKLIYLISFVLVLGLVQVSVAESADPNLVGWWKFDESNGTTATDSSGGGNHGTLVNGQQWVAGRIGGALQFRGSPANDYVSLPIGSVISKLPESTFSIWVNWSGIGGGWQRIFDFGTDTANYIYLCPSTAAANVAMRVAIVANVNGTWDDLDSSVGPLTTGWHHIAVTVSKSSKTIILYLDGEIVGSLTNIVNTVSDLGDTTNNWLGRSQYPDPYFNGSLDDFRIYNRVLPQAEIKKVANPEKAPEKTPVPTPAPAPAPAK